MEMTPESFDTPIIFRAIGYVENSFTQPAAPEGIRSVESRIIVRAELAQGLEGLSPGDSLLVLFYFHLSDGYSLLQHPRGDRSRPKRGVFALRSPRRPNGIGATVVELVSVRDNVLLVRNLDAIHGTPVLDIKPA